ncbi:ribose-phosphate diphosphokinase [Porticoccus sp.]|uniref:ribose-phosphate diphosphokinase n=1 Tax=Porticoccus sp. TaxID=2024853 RepID=UPI003F6950C8
MNHPDKQPPLLFSLDNHPLLAPLCHDLAGAEGILETRLFPDGETYLKVVTPVIGCHCIVVANLANPNGKYLPLTFLLETLRELGASSIGLVAPYLCYMRQDCRFHDGEAVTSRLFARMLSSHIDWLVTVDPHLHRYHSLADIYTVPTTRIEGTVALTEWLTNQASLLLIGPDSESEQWVSRVATASGHPYVIGEKQRHGDRDVLVTLPDVSGYRDRTAVIIDDVISSGQTILKCLQALRQQGITRVKCAAIHGIFADSVDVLLMQSGLTELATCNTIPHVTNRIDVTTLLVPAMQEYLAAG